MIDADGTPGKAADARANRRTLTLCAAGAVLGLAIAGLGLFTAKGTRTSQVPAEDVAIVNQVPVLMSDYLAQLRGLYDVPLSRATPAQRRRVLDDMIREELYVQRGVELGMPTDTVEVRTALVGGVEAQAAADATMAQPDEATLRGFYAAHRSRYADQGRMTVADYLVAPGANAAAAAAGLRAGRDPAALGLQRSGAMADGEEYWFAARLHLGEALFAAAAPLRDGEVSAPVRVAGVTHILAMARNVPPRVQPLANVRDRVIGDYTDAQAKLLKAGNDRFLRKRADIVVQRGFE